MPNKNTQIQPLYCLVNTAPVRLRADKVPADQVNNDTFFYSVQLAKSLAVNVYYVIFNVVRVADNKKMLFDALTFNLEQRTEVISVINSVYSGFEPHEKNVLRFNGQIYDSYKEVEQILELWSKNQLTTH